MRLPHTLFQIALLWCGHVPAIAAADKPYSVWMTDSLITRGVPATRWYTEATFYRGVEAVANLTADPSYHSFLTTSVDTLLLANGTFRGWDYKDHQLDNIRVGSTLLYLHTRTQSPKYAAAASFLHNQLVVQQKRTPSGGFWHKDPKYPNQMWLDGLFMAAPFYAAHTALFQPSNTTAWDDVLLQFALVEQHCKDAQTHMLRHGYDESLRAAWADRAGGTGASPHVWIRAQGWYLMALVDVLEWFPRAHPGYQRLVGWFRELAAAVKREQDPASGGWWLVMDQPYPGQKGNYVESSGTAMYTYGLLKGVRRGLFAEGEAAGYVEVAKKAYRLMVERFVAKNGTGGTLNWEGTVRVGSLDGNGDYKYYTTVPVVENSLIGAGPFISASVEMELYNAKA
ncbi:putative cell wall glycosyl hydrolase YteR [Lasiosphaeria hispida]|uniref:Cell wall glycosyl hydrolase YteR n=1 Tax=Lasiosphaeria hispida TaxID=260671 RepID=A0AAJ0HBL6_9PEZI|nr:putative cell wall glycosyl hydrolase YteR [Lasiosphaeria hispida]